MQEFFSLFLNEINRNKQNIQASVSTAPVNGPAMKNPEQTGPWLNLIADPSPKPTNTTDSLSFKNESSIFCEKSHV